MAKLADQIWVGGVSAFMLCDELRSEIVAVLKLLERERPVFCDEKRLLREGPVLYIRASVLCDKCKKEHADAK